MAKKEQPKKKTTNKEKRDALIEQKKQLEVMIVKTQGALELIEGIIKDEETDKDE